jgi:hypothetical protein
MQSIPFDKLNDADRQRVQRVLDETTIYRRLPASIIQCNPQLFLFLVRHPEVVVNIWEVLGVSQVALERTSPHTFRASDGHGTIGLIEVLHDQFNKQLVYAQGTYEGPLLVRPVKATCVLVLQMEYALDSGGRYFVTGYLDAFVHLDRASVEVLAKTFQPLVTRSADYNFTETMTFVSSLSRTAELNPRGLERICRKLTKVSPETRERLLQISDYASARPAVKAAELTSAGEKLATGTPSREPRK